MADDEAGDATPPGRAGASMPPDPFGSGQESWVQIHEWYTGLRSGGFRWFEALFFMASNTALGAVIAAGQSQQQEPEQE